VGVVGRGFKEEDMNNNQEAQSGAPDVHEEEKKHKSLLLQGARGKADWGALKR